MMSKCVVERHDIRIGVEDEDVYVFYGYISVILNTVYSGMN